ncbi:MAG: hypothetical protein JNL12_16085 [Planctomycetes bacterium]|nr:hypothetical protein [Planctomycetota bacterium]
MDHSPRPNVSRLAVVASCVLAAACSAPRAEKPIVNLLERAGICLADFEIGLSFASDLNNCFWFGFPSEEELAAHRDAGDFVSYAWVEDARFAGSSGPGANVLLMDGTRGDFAQARVVTGRYEDETGSVQRVVYGCLLTLRAAAAGPGPATADGELARLGVELREPFAYWHGLGVLHSTSKPMVYALIEPSSGGPRVTSLFRAAHERIPFANGECLLVADLEAKAAERLGEIRYGGPPWRSRYEAAAAAGIPEAARAIAQVDAARTTALQAAIAACAACPANAVPTTRCKAVAELAAKVRSLGPTDPRANEALRAERAKLASTYARGEAAVRENGDRLEARLLAWLVSRPLAEDVHELAMELDGQVWVLDWIGTTRDKALLDRLRLHAELARTAGPHGVTAEFTTQFQTQVRLALADSFEAAGREAAGKALHATAAGRFLIADSLCEPGRRTPERQSLVAVAGGDGGEPRPQGALQLARTEGLQLLARVFPFVERCDVTVEAWGKECGAHEFADLLQEMPIADPQALGLDPGRGEEQLRFAHHADLLVPGLSVPLLTVSVSPMAITDVQVTTDKEERVGEVVSRSMAANDAAVDAWIAEVNGLTSRIDALDSSIAAARGDVRVTGTTTASTALFGDTRTYTLTSTFESMDSAIARVQAMGRVEQLSAERDRLREQLVGLLGRRPSGSRVELSTSKVRCEIEYQRWTFKFRNVVRIEGGAEPVTMTIETAVQKSFARNRASPVLGIEAADEWTTEDRIRKDPPIAPDSRQKVVQFALRRCLARRVDELRDEIRARDLAEEDRVDELGWLTWLVTPVWRSEDPESEGQGQLLALARAHWAR